jgi:hypothetical protein
MNDLKILKDYGLFLVDTIVNLHQSKESEEATIFFRKMYGNGIVELYKQKRKADLKKMLTDL